MALHGRRKHSGIRHKIGARRGLGFESLERRSLLSALSISPALPRSDAGMAAIVTDGRFDIGEFANHLAKRLPVYALPVMIRICAALDTTETFKQKKHELVRDGFDPHQVTDPLFFREPKSGEYRPIDERAYARIADGSVRF